MKKNDSQGKINLISYKNTSFYNGIHKSDKIYLTNKKENMKDKMLFLNKKDNTEKILLKTKKDENDENIRIIEKIKLEKENYIKKNFKTSFNSHFWHGPKKYRTPLKFSKNANIHRNSEELKNIKNDNNSIEFINTTKSQSIKNIKDIFPSIKQQKKKFVINFNENKKDKYKEININNIRSKLKYPKTERNFFNNYNSILTRNMNPYKQIINYNYNNNQENNNIINNLTKYKFIVRPENCGYLIVKCFKHRKNWIEIKNDYDNQNFHFKWQQNIKNIYYNNLSKNTGYKQMVNHFEFHNLLTNKANLFYNMMKYAEIIDENVFKYIPFTILFEYNNDKYFKKIEKFQYLFNNIKDYIIKSDDLDKIKYRHSKGKLYHSFFPFDNHLGSKTAINILETHLYLPEDNDDYNEEEKKDEEKNENKTKNKKINNNFWLIKAPNLNRGMCIQILNDFNLIQKYISYYNRGISRGYQDDNLSLQREKIKARNQQKFSDFFNNEKEETHLYQSSTIIVQKYIEKPLLYFGRKFDIRIWVLLTHDLKVYVFNEGHLKCCSVKYDLSSTNNYSHLTNYSFQKYNNNFGKYELGNEVSFDDLQNNIDINYDRRYNFKREILPKIHNIIKFCFQSVKSKINSMNRKYTFEIFGFDFMIDCNFEPSLIEINTNPGLEESSPLIKMLIPRMLDDALRLTVDKEFDTLYNFDGYEINSHDKSCDYIYHSPFPVNGYLNSENIFKLICDLNSNEKNRRFSSRKFNFNNKNSKNKFQW